MKRFALALFLLPIVAPGCATSSNTPGAQAGQPAVNQPMPALSMQDFEGGNELRLADLKGKVVLLDIWASWCAPCKEEMPLLDDIAARMKKDGVEVVAVSIDEERADAETFLATKKRWSLRLAHDPKGQVPELLKPPKMPTSYLIDRKGVLRAVQLGFQREDVVELEKKLKELAAE